MQTLTQEALVSTDPAYLLGANVISSFHCYGTSDGGATSGSYGFTHQGESSAANPYLALISNLEWPANSGNITTVSSGLGQLGAVSGKATAQSYVTAYGSGETTSANLLAEIATSQSWARTYSPWTICTEFGCTSLHQQQAGQHGYRLLAGNLIRLAPVLDMEFHGR